MPTNYSDGIRGKIVSATIYTLVFGLFMGWAWWLWLAYFFGSFGMFIVGLVPPLYPVVGLIGFWSFLFGTPLWLLHMVR